MYEVTEVVDIGWSIKYRQVCCVTETDYFVSDGCRFIFNGRSKW